MPSQNWLFKTLYAFVVSAVLSDLSWIAGLGDDNARAAGAWVRRNIKPGSAIGVNHLPSADFPPFEYLNYKLQYAMSGPWLILTSYQDMPSAPPGYRIMFWNERPWYSYSSWPFPCRDFVSITQEPEVSIWRRE